MKKKLMILILIVIPIWIAFIFYFSSRPSDISYQQSDWMMGKLIQIEKDWNLNQIEDGVRSLFFRGEFQNPRAFMRKSAHLGIYFGLGILCILASYFYTNKLVMGIITGISLPITIAVVDEYYQRFYGRTSLLEDVIIDGTGAIAGVVIVTICIVLFKVGRYFLTCHKNNCNKK